MKKLLVMIVSGALSLQLSAMNKIHTEQKGRESKCLETVNEEMLKQYDDIACSENRVRNAISKFGCTMSNIAIDSINLINQQAYGDSAVGTEEVWVQMLEIARQIQDFAAQNSQTSADLELIYAVKEESEGLVEIAFNKKANPNIKIDGRPLFFDVVIKGNQDILQLFIEAGVTVDIKNHRGHTALMFASSDIAKMLLDAGVDANFQDNQGNTALIFSAHAHNVARIELLLAHGADINLKNHEGISFATYLEPMQDQESIALKQVKTICQSIHSEVQTQKIKQTIRQQDGTLGIE